MKCSECPKQIPQERLDIWPHVKTCSKICSALRSRRINRDIKRRSAAKRTALARKFLGYTND